MKPKEIREMSIKDLRERIETEKANLAQMKINHAVSPIEDTSKIRIPQRSERQERTSPVCSPS